MIAFVQRPGGRAGAHLRGARGRRRRPRAPVHPGHARRAARGRRGDAADQHGGPRGLADALRLRRRGREADVRAAADRQRRRARSWPRRCSPCTGPRRCAGPSAATTSRRSPRCPASARRAPSGSSSSSTTGSGRRARRRPRPRSASPARATGRDRCRPGWSGLGWSAKEADRAIGEVAPEAEQMATPDVARLLRAALRTLSRREGRGVDERVRARRGRAGLRDQLARSPPRTPTPTTASSRRRCGRAPSTR